MGKAFRTDIASEALSLHGDFYSAPGLSCRQENLLGFELCHVSITNKAAAERIGKPIGEYFTLDIADTDRRSENFPNAVRALSDIICRCISAQPGSCLIAALGNPDITPDAIGPLSAESILVTRHLKENGEPLFSAFSPVAVCRTGVLGTSGFESALHIKTLCESLKPDFVIAVDALAGSEPSALCRCIQVSSSGIAPGSGVKNDRMALDSQSLGVPVIAVGMPTVIDASLFCGETPLSDMFVTPRGIDSMVRSAARIIGFGINAALHPGLSISDMEALLG